MYTTHVIGSQMNGEGGGGGGGGGSLNHLPLFFCKSVYFTNLVILTNSQPCNNIAQLKKNKRNKKEQHLIF